MSTFLLTEQQLNAATSRSRTGRGSRLLRSGRLLALLAAAALVAVQVILGQYIGAAIFLALLAAIILPLLLRWRDRRGNAGARAKRLSSVLYRVEVSETALELEYDQSLLHMSFDNLLVTKRNPDFYVVHHELGLFAYLPVLALTTEEQRILDRHVSSGSFDWRSRPRGRGGR